MVHPAPRKSVKQTRSSQLLGDLRAAVLEGQLAPGEKVNLERLREAHSVSLSPLREALSRLIAERMVEFEDLKGYRVAPISEANLREVTQLRADIEALALRYAIAQGGLDWEGDIPAALHRLKRAGAEDEGSGLAPAHEAFHQALTAGCTSTIMLEFTSVLRNLHMRYGNVLGYDAADRDLDAEHSAIAEATLARDADLAVALLRRHVERCGQDMLVLMVRRHG